MGGDAAEPEEERPGPVEAAPGVEAPGGEGEEEDPPAPPRLREAAGEDLRGLGRALAANYGLQMRQGLHRAKEYYTRLPPITCSEAQWRGLAEHARAGAQQCCPTASAFFDGLEDGLGWDVYEALLDFEVYTLELQRQARGRTSSPSSSSSSSSSGSRKRGSAGGSAKCSSGGSSSSSSIGGALSQLGLGASAAPAAEEGAAEEGAVEPAAAGDADKEALPGRCTGFALVDGGRACVVAQTADLPHVLYGFGDFDCALRLRIPGGGAVVYDSDGRLCPIGLSSAGLGVSVFNLHQTQTNGFEQPSLSVQSVAWELLLGRHSVASAKAWLQSLPVPPMCGGALLLADSNGAVTVELNPGGPPTFGELHCGRPVVRANHPLLEACIETYGGTERARLESEKRQQRITSRLAKSCLEEGPQPVFAGADALRVLKGSSKVRNLSTLACLALDLRCGLLHVEFRERQRALAEEVAKLAQELDLPAEKVEKAMLAGSVRCDTGRRRMATGKPTVHLVRWAPHVFPLDSE